MRDAQLETTGTIYNKSIQIFAYADNIDIVGQTVICVKEAFFALSAAKNTMGTEKKMKRK
jgi:hypothetical protein